jgi:Flp pilus assembly protein TadD
MYPNARPTAVSGSAAALRIGQLSAGKMNAEPHDLNQIRFNTHFTYGKEFLRAGRYRQALESFDKALELNPEESRALMGRSLALTRLGRYDEAMAAATAIFDFEPDSPYGCNAQAVCYQAMGRMPEARAAFEKSVEFGRDNAGNHYNFAIFWASCDEAEQCRKYLARALELEPKLNVIAATDIDLKRYRTENWFLELVSFK